MPDHEVWVWVTEVAGRESASQARCDTCSWKGKVHRVSASRTPMKCFMAAQAEKDAHLAAKALLPPG